MDDQGGLSEAIVHRRALISDYGKADFGQGDADGKSDRHNGPKYVEADRKDQEVRDKKRKRNKRVRALVVVSSSTHIINDQMIFP